MPKKSKAPATAGPAGATIDASGVTFVQSVAGGIVTQTLAGTAQETVQVAATTGSVPLVADDGTTVGLAVTTTTNPRTFPLTPAASGLHTFKLAPGTFPLADGRVATVAANGLSYSYPA